MKRSTTSRAIVTVFVLVAVMSSVVMVNAQTTQAPDGSCPTGFVPRPLELNPTLGRCVPGSLAANVPLFDNNPDTCLPGFVPRPPELNPALGPCVPGSLAANTFVISIIDNDPTTCPEGWVRASPPLNSRLGCLPTEIGIPQNEN